MNTTKKSILSKLKINNIELAQKIDAIILVAHFLAFKWIDCLLFKRYSSLKCFFIIASWAKGRMIKCIFFDLLNTTQMVLTQSRSCCENFINFPIKNVIVE